MAIIETKDLWLVPLSLLGIYLYGWQRQKTWRYAGLIIASFTTTAIAAAYGVWRGALHLGLFLCLSIIGRNRQ